MSILTNNNTEYVTTIGSTGRVLEFLLQDDQGWFDMTGFSAVLNLTAANGDAIIANLACEVVNPQVTDQPQLTVTIDFTVDEYELLTVTGSEKYHKLRLVLTDGSSNISYYPGTRAVNYGRVYVLAQ
jgi:hypothetical protein